MTLLLEERLELLNQTDFQEQDKNESGKQSVVLSRDDLDFVVKIPRPENKVVRCYQLGISRLKTIIPETQILRNARITIEGVVKNYPAIIIQEKLQPFSFTNLEAIEKYSLIHKTILNQGLYCADVHYLNVGISNGKVLLFDLGHIDENVYNDEKIRLGINLYIEFFRLIRHPELYVHYEKCLEIDANPSVALLHVNSEDLERNMKKVIGLSWRYYLELSEDLARSIFNDFFHERQSDLYNLLREIKYESEFKRISEQLISKHYKRFEN